MDRSDRKTRKKKLLDDLKERRGYSHLKEEALDRTMWRARFGKGFGPVVRQTNKLINERMNEITLIFKVPKLSVLELQNFPIFWRRKQTCD
jgi:hypothetical protein